MIKAEKVYVQFKMSEGGDSYHIDNVEEIKHFEEANIIVIIYKTEKGQTVEKHIKLDCLKYMNLYK